MVVFVVGVGLLALVARGWLRPTSGDGVLGLDPPFQAISDRYDAALEAAQPDEALAWVDEYLLSAGGGAPEARRAWDMRDAARLQGARFNGYPADRSQAWRLRRVAGRRPGWEWLAAGLGVLLALGSVVSVFVRREPDRPLPNLGG